MLKKLKRENPNLINFQKLLKVAKVVIRIKINILIKIKLMRTIQEKNKQNLNKMREYIKILRENIMKLILL